MTNDEYIELVKEYHEALNEVKKYANSLKWCRNFFDEDSEVIQDVKEDLDYSIREFREVVVKLLEHGVPLADLILIGEGIDREDIERTYRPY